MRAVAIVLAAGSVDGRRGAAVQRSGRRPSDAGPGAAAPLKSAADFTSIQDPATRSLALFAEAGKVIESPRCMNCHPVQRAPTQGDDRHPPDPPMVGGQGGHGPMGMPCSFLPRSGQRPDLGAGHQVDPRRSEMGAGPGRDGLAGQVAGRDLRPDQGSARNGGKSLAQLHHHMAEDHLVGWAWNPGEGRVPAPGTQARFGELVRAWIDTGAKCPKA